MDPRPPAAHRSEDIGPHRGLRVREVPAAPILALVATTVACAVLSCAGCGSVRGTDRPLLQEAGGESGAATASDRAEVTAAK